MFDKMMEYSEYASQADTVKFEDITSSYCNATILRRLKENDAQVTNLWLQCYREDVVDYVPDNAHNAGWLGYFAGKNIRLDTFLFDYQLLEGSSITRGEEELIAFCRGFCHNKTIRSMKCYSAHLFNGVVFPFLAPLFKHNHNLTDMSMINCGLGAEEHRQFSLALAGCKCLKKVTLLNCGIGDEQCADIAVALSMQPMLETLKLIGNHIATKGCKALSTLIRSATELTCLDLSNNDIDDEGVDALVGGLIHHNKLRVLDLNINQSITLRGLKTISTLLESPSSYLKGLYLNGLAFGDEEALLFSKALANNIKLDAIEFDGNHNITATGWAAFTELLCDTSSVNNTHQSNHSLTIVSGTEQLPTDLADLLELNEDDDKKSVAIGKILRYHRDIDLKPLFEWEFKTLPLVSGLFERAAECTDISQDDIKRRELSAIYQFVRGLPVLYVEAHTGKSQTKKKRKFGN